jgi:hypothetical protein
MLALAVVAWFASAHRPHCAEAGQRGNPTSGPHSLRIGPNGDELVFDGFIAAGVADEFARLLKRQRNVKVIRLNSPGGRLFEAQRIGELIRRRNLDTFVSGRCFSACAIVFLHGKERRLDFGAVLGFHQASYPGMDAEGRRRAMAVQGGILRKLGMPADFVRKVNATPPHDIWIPSAFALMDAHVVTATADAGIARHPVAKAESGGPATRIAGFLGPGPVRDKFISAANAACLNGESGAQVTAGELSCRCYADRLADIVADVEAERFASGGQTLAMFKDRSGVAIKECFAVPDPTRTIARTDLVTPAVPVSRGSGKTGESSTARPRGFNPPPLRFELAARGPQRDRFASELGESCAKRPAGEVESDKSEIPQAALNAYCRCYAARLADAASDDELRGYFAGSGRMGPALNDKSTEAMKQCVLMIDIR